MQSEGVGDGIWHLQSDGARDPEKPTTEVFAEVAEQTRLADDLGYAIAWFAEAISCSSPSRAPLTNN
jgi:alkanesulfonate monooxygenase SsuD/methylene tetrahydromethanopterin reductase-like flavin-dependent oxidoreductase (luciferase family)